MNISNEARIAIEKRITRAMIRHLKARGWAVAVVYDGEVSVYPRTEAQAMGRIFNLDEASVRFIRADKLDAFRAARVVNLRGPVEERDDNDWGDGPGDGWTDHPRRAPRAG